MLIPAYLDPDTGEVYESVDDALPRNARPRPRGPARHPGMASAGRLGFLGSRRPASQADHMSRGERQPTIIRTPRAEAPTDVRSDGEYVSIKKEAVLELVPTLGELASASLGMPAAPRYTNDDAANFANEAMHREALARHDQTRERIRVTSNLLARFAKIMMT